MYHFRKPMNRRELIRNALLTLGATAVNMPAGALMFPPGDDASVKLARADWKPVFLNADQNETLIVLSDAIIPATDTPGAKAALVNRFLDLVLTAVPAEAQHDFIESLDWFNTGAVARYKVTFPNLTSEEKQEFLNLVAWPHTLSHWGTTDVGFSGYEHFTRLKGWISDAFYSSPIGLKEMGWDGWAARGTFRGCDHQPEEHQDAT